MPYDFIRAYEHSTQHSAELLASDVCGCFHCLGIFPPMFITHWVDKDEDGVGQTALCPHCGMDAVLGSASGFTITDALLQEMHGHWFSEKN
jgi:hypothetical protein